MGRPRKFYLVFCPYGGATRIVDGLDALYRATGQRYGTGFKTRLRAEEFAAWRDYRYGYPYSVNNPRNEKGAH